MNDKVKSIWEKRHVLEQAERKARKAYLDVYHETPEYKQYLAGMKALRDECEQKGHVFGSFHDNGLGWSWSYCSQCGGRYDIEKHNFDLPVDDDNE